ncbi:MAG TPA: hypothetical protein DGG94_17470 [Micromonosporaceae bacterium]|nr:hypothetical protein [Micromonosporaceae bacterium]HCU51560.1 hypothetical protein [Micromonosporaceae bacterium]
MTTVDVTVLIDRPIEEVYGFVTDLRNEPKWWLGVSRAERLAGDGGVGTRYTLEAKLLGLSVPTDIEVTEADPPHRLTIVAGGKMPYVCRYAFQPGAKGTELSVTAEIESKFPWRYLGPVLTLVMRHHLRRLNRILAN